MSLLGRLEDLFLTDIIQIVFLSRRTGVLEIIDGAGRHTVLFRHGLVVNASAPDQPDLVTFLFNRGVVPADSVRVIRQMEDNGVACGTAVMEMNLISSDDLATAIHDRILGVITPLLESREGEFNFILSETMHPVDMEYDVDKLLDDGGFAPQKIVGLAEGEKLKPLRALEETLKAGKALLRGASSTDVTPASLNLGLGEPLDAPRAAPARPAEQPGEASLLPFPPVEQPPFDVPEPEPSERPRTSQFKVAGGLFEVETPEATYRNVILFERDPLVRVAARRAFGKRGVRIVQYGTLGDVRSAINDLFRSNSFFVTFLELTADDASLRLMQQLKHRNPRLPVVVIDREADLRRRHDLLRAGADLYLTRPSQERMQPEMAEEELALFADELVLFADRSFQNWEQLTGSFGADAGKRFYEMAERENVDRSFGVLKQLINELSNPNDIGQVSATILRLSGEYLERGALFIVSGDEFAGLGGFGVTGGGESMDARVRGLRIPLREPSILSDVVASGHSHKGKMRRTPANVRLIEAMGNQLPTEVVVLPVMHNQQGIGILYGDNAEHRTPIDVVTGLEIFLSQAGYAFGNAVAAWTKNGRGREGT
ncbi:MAG TPA: response regulator [Thermoanaerobaculia bacterium]